MLRSGNWRFADPESVAQEVQLRLVEIARSGRVQDPGSFQKYVYTVAKNTCVDVYHRERRRETHEDDAVAADVADPASDAQARLERRERIELFAYVLQRLPESCRTLLDWVYRGRMSAAQAGERLGLTANNVRVRVHRCLEKARAIYREAAAWPASAGPKSE